jgi:hypothetical protein
MVHPNSLRNLKPFGNANTMPRVSSSVRRAIITCRKASPEAVEYLLRVLRDEREETKLRVKCAELIMARGLGAAGQAGHAGQALRLEHSANTLRIEIVDPSRSDAVIDVDSYTEESCEAPHTEQSMLLSVHGGKDGGMTVGESPGPPATSEARGP